MVNLEILYVNENPLSDISPLAGLAKLDELHVQLDQISDISPLSHVPNLRLVNMMFNQVSDIAPLTTLRQLDVVAMQGNPLDEAAYCIHLDQTAANNPYVALHYDRPCPYPPSGLSASHGTFADRVRLAWSPYCLGPVGMDTAYYAIYRATSEDGARTMIGFWQTATEFEDTTVELGVVYYYWVRASINPKGYLGVTDYSYYDTGWCEARSPGLNISSRGAGSVVTPGEGAFPYPAGSVVAIEAVAEANHHFTRWTGTAVEVDRVANPAAAATTVTVDANYTLVANFMPDALAKAAAGDSIWIAEGQYWPDLGVGCQAGDRTATFRLKSGVALYGGFPTGGGTWSQRNPGRNRSILSGDIGKAGVPGDNSYHVVTGSGTDRTAILDGCVITGGYADGGVGYVQGAGMYNQSGSPTVKNCTFIGNNAVLGSGGGACNRASQATFINCVFNNNTAGKYGGGLACDEGSNVAVVNCTFVANRGLMRAGGVFNNAGTMTVTNGIFWGNSRVGEIFDEWAQASGDPYPAVNYCCLQGWMGMLGGQGNLGNDPLFVDSAGPDSVAGTPDDDFRLSGGSPCLDRGDNTAVPPEAATDLAGGPRILNGIVDLGAYEFNADPNPEVP